MKRVLTYAITAIFLAWAASSAGAGEKIVLKVGHDSSTDHPYEKGLEKFKAVLEAETKGAVEVQIFPNAQLGDEKQMVQGLRLGTIDAAISSTGNLAGFVSEVDLFNLPFVFRDSAHVYRVLDGPIGQRVGKAIEAKTNSVLLGWYDSGFRTMWDSKRPINSPADLKGLKMRVMASPLMVDTFNALGAQATPLPFGELYTALQQGVVDGADNDPVDILAEKFFEVTKYVSLTNHFASSSPFMFSKKRFDTLPPEIQKAVIEAGRQSVSVAREAQLASAKAALDQLKQKGLQIFTVDQKPFKDAIGTVYMKYGEKVGGMQAIEEISKY